VAGGLLLTERQLLAVMGSPTAQLRVLRDLGLAPTDPVSPLLAVLAFMAETLIGYVVVILALRSLSVLPGAVGGLTGRAAFLLSPGVVRRALDLLVGGTLLAQALTATPGTAAGRAPDSIGTLTTVSVRSSGPAGAIGPTG
jgi:hypothetical protein